MSAAAPPSLWAIFGYAFLTAIATGVGVLPLAFARQPSARHLGMAHALAAGLMIGASVGLVREGIALSVALTGGGVLAGMVAMRLAERWIGDHDTLQFAGVRGANARRMLFVVAAMTAHSFAEGIALGVSFGGGVTLGLAIVFALAIHNVPEGLAIGAVLRPQGVSLLACVGWSIFSSLPQPLMAIPAYLLVERFVVVLPFGLGFAAGAMASLSATELVPEAAAVIGRRRTVAWLLVAAAGMLALDLAI